MIVTLDKMLEVAKKTLQEKQKRNELIQYQLQHIDEIIINNPFNPLDESTYDFASKDKLLIVDKIPIYKELYLSNGSIQKEYVFEYDFVHLYRMYSHKNKISIDYFYLHYSHCFPIIQSNLIIDGFTYTAAQADMINHLSESDKIKLTRIIKEHFNNKEKKYRLRQNIFDNNIHIDNYLFTDLIYTDSLIDEQEIMYDYYIDSDEIEYIYNSSYLNLFPRLKNEILKDYKK